MMGDFNGVADSQMDKQLRKKGGNLLKIFFELVEQEHLEDLWRKWNKGVKNFTYFLTSKQSFSRIDMIWASKYLVTMTKKMRSYLGYFQIIIQ